MRIRGAVAVAGFVLLSTTVAFAPPGTVTASLSLEKQDEPGDTGKTAPTSGSSGVSSYLVDLRVIFYSGAVSIAKLTSYREDPRSCMLPVCLAATEEEIISTAHRALKTRQPDEEGDDSEAWDRAIDVWNTSIAGVAALAGISGTAIAYAVGRRKGEASGTKRKTSRMAGGASAASRSRSRATVKNTRRASDAAT